MKSTYFKVYQDRYSMHGDYYVDTIENCINQMAAFMEQCNENDEILPPVFEPVEMTEGEFNDLPEFEGY